MTQFQSLGQTPLESNPTAKLFGYKYDLIRALHCSSRSELGTSQAKEALCWVNCQDFFVPESQSLATLNPSCLQSPISGVAIFYFQSFHSFFPLSSRAVQLTRY